MADVDIDSNRGTCLDPRIKVELELLNTASAEINRLEKQLDESRQQFRQTLTESTQSLNEKLKKCRKSAAKAQSYYAIREEARKAQESAQEAALRYQRAASMFSAAKETIGIAEEAAITTEGQHEKKRQFDSALQEMLNLSTTKLNAAEKEKRDSQREHEERSQRYITTQQKVDELGKKFKRSIAKSSAYYELKKTFFFEMNDLKIRTEALQGALQESKDKYRKALKNLEKISEDIHQSRQVAAILAESRQSGVGADSNTDSDAEPERLEIPFQIDEIIDNISLGTDQESVPSDAASLASPKTAMPPTANGFQFPPRSVSGSSAPSPDEWSDGKPITVGRSDVKVASSSVSKQKDSTNGKRNSTFLKLKNGDDDDVDDDDDDEIFLGVETDDELDDSDDEIDGKNEDIRKLRTISIGDLRSFNMFSVADQGDSVSDAKKSGHGDVGKSPEGNPSTTTDKTESTLHSKLQERDDIGTADMADDTINGATEMRGKDDGTVTADPASDNVIAEPSAANENTEDDVVWI